MLEVIKPFLDPDQCGIKGMSTTHYLINFLHFIQSNLDVKRPNAVIGAFIDMSKAFNRVDHNILIEDLFKMGCPAWLLKTVISFLSNRTLIVNFKGSKSLPKQLPGGSPQGTFLGVICFIVKFNSALLRPPIVRNNLLNQSKAVKAKYVDDSSIAVSVPLDDLLERDPEKRVKPLNFSERTEHVLPKTNNLLQSYLDEVEQFVEVNGMKINKLKTKVIKYTRTKVLDFPLEVAFKDNKNLEVVTHMKLLGVMISDSLKWDMNTDYICQKARGKIWLIRNMKHSGLNQMQLVDAYKKEVRSILEMAVPVWNSGLTLQQVLKIERVQKIGLSAFLDTNYKSYENSLKKLKL